MLLVASDPWLSSVRTLPKKQIRELTDDVKSFLILCETDKIVEETSGGEKSKSASDSDEKNNITNILTMFK